MSAQIGPVLVGTDFSDNSGVALAEARRLAARMGTWVEVLHVVDGGPSIGWGEQGEAGRWLSTAGLEPDELMVRFGSPPVELARRAAELVPELIVVGSHGRSGYQPLGLGSTAARISVQARCPVVLVSPRVDRQELWGGEEPLQDVGRDGAAANYRGPTDGGKTR
jgi:nucleotide-binding universal stress UspA family protein